jgi:hypothetical protein
VPLVATVFRRTALVVTIAALAASGTASAAPADAGVELAGGSGKAVVALEGAVLGSLDRGRITVVTRRGEPLVLVQGYEWVRTGQDGSTVYGGRDIRFRVFRGAWRVTLQGGGINASAVGTGSIGLRGIGRYSLDGGAYRTWPDEYKVILLGDS